MNSLRSCSFVWASLASLAALACGSNVDGGAGGAGGEDVGEQVQCSDYDDELSSSEVVPVTIRMVNRLEVDLYFTERNASSATSRKTPFTVEQDGAQVETQLGGMAYSCERVMSGNCGFMGDVPRGDEVLRVVPGGALERSWSALVFELRQLPEACAAPECGSSLGCYVPALAEGRYVVSASASVEAPLCVAEPGDCPCTPDADGVCELGALAGYGPSSFETASAEIILGDEGERVVELVFE
jgi:hypothetical protein